MKDAIPFNLPFLTGKETSYIEDSVRSGKISGNGAFTRRCHAFFEQRYKFQKCLLTSSCTDALEMSALLLNISPGDEIILPSFTFVSTANAFALRGATLVFADSCSTHPNIDPEHIESLITPHTRGLVVVHYGGVACNMQRIQEIAQKHSLFVVEDAAHAIDAYHNDQPLGSLGHLATFSFHETKNIICGEGGMLVVNDPQFAGRSEVIWEKGTNRAAFSRGELRKYEWIDVGSSFLPSEIVAAFLFAQLEQLDNIQARRVAIWNRYFERLQPLERQGHVQLPYLPDYATKNGHLFYVLCPDERVRQELIAYLSSHGVGAVFHYLPLHSAPFHGVRYRGPPLPNADRFSRTLLRLPLYYNLPDSGIERVSKLVSDFFGMRLGA